MRGEQLGLNEDEVTFYDALEVNDSAVKVLGDATLKLIAQELVRAVKSSVTIDWTGRENVRAQMRVIIRRILRKYVLGEINPVKLPEFDAIVGDLPIGVCAPGYRPALSCVPSIPPHLGGCFDVP